MDKSFKYRFITRKIEVKMYCCYYIDLYRKDANEEIYVSSFRQGFSLQICFMMIFCSWLMIYSLSELSFEDPFGALFTRVQHCSLSSSTNIITDKRLVWWLWMLPSTSAVLSADRSIQTVLPSTSTVLSLLFVSFINKYIFGSRH